MTVANGCMLYVIRNLALPFSYLRKLLRIDLYIQNVKKISK